VTKITTRKRRKPEIGALRDPVILCMTTEIPDQDVSTIKDNPAVMRVMASIVPLRGDTVLNYKAVMLNGKNQPPTVQITIRTPPDVKIDLNHKIYHLGKYGETWYNIDTVEDLGGAYRFAVMLCSVEWVRDRRSDPATQPQKPEWPTPTDATGAPIRVVDDVI
jgi:hypothetical protein